MKRTMLGVTALVIGLFASAHYAANNTTDSPVGYWKTIDDATGQPKSIVQIWKAENDVLVGKVVRIYPKDGSSKQDKTCTACEGDRHNQPIVGMVILSGLKASENKWGNGKILDPENGKSYSCSLRVSDKGKKLNVHGYIGIPLLGRSQTWERVDLMSSK